MGNITNHTYFIITVDQIKIWKNTPLRLNASFPPKFLHLSTIGYQICYIFCDFSSISYQVVKLYYTNIVLKCKNFGERRRLIGGGYDSGFTSDRLYLIINHNQQ